MKKISTLLFSTFCLGMTTLAQIAPTASPYSQNGQYTIVSDSVNVPSSKKVVMYRPNTPPVGQKYPTLIFQPGANGFGASAINVHTYDLYMKHLASYGYVVLVIDATAGGIPNGAEFKKVYTWYKTNAADANHWLNTYSNSSKVFVAGHSNGGVNASALVASNGSPTEIAGIIYFASYPSNNFAVSQNVTNYAGYVLDLAGDTDGTTDLADAKTGYNKFTGSQCRTFVSITGADHGAFGDYVNTGQPVGVIGRTDATATIRHYLVSFMEAYSKNNLTANNNINLPSKRPTTTTEFLSTCSITTNLSEITNSTNISIYPNPSNEFLFVKMNGINPSSTLKMYDMLGQSIDAKITLDKMNAETFYINTSKLNDGMYTIRVSNDNVNFISKSFIVKK